MDEDEMTTEATFAELTWIKDYILDRNGTYKKQDLFKDTLYFIDHIYDPAYEFTVSEIVKEIRYLKANFKDRKTLEEEKKLEKKKNKENGNRLFSSYLEQKFEECAKKENMELNAFKTQFRSEWLLPVISGKKCLIPFVAGEKSDALDDMKNADDESMSMMLMLMSSLKARVLVDKSLVPKMKSACFIGNGVEDYQIPFYDYGPAWCLEIPLSVLLEREAYQLDTIVVTKK